MRCWLDLVLRATSIDYPTTLVDCVLSDSINRPERAENATWMVDRFMRLYDLLYVHGDPRLFRLEDSFPEFTALDGRLHYTGFVTEAEAAVSAARSNGRHGAPGSGEVIV